MQNEKGMERDTGVRSLSAGDTGESDYARLTWRALRDTRHLLSSTEFLVNTQFSQLPNS